MRLLLACLCVLLFGLPALADGMTAGQASAGSSGTVTQINTGTGLTGGPITTTGTISLDSIANNTVLGNISGVGAAPIAISQTQLTALINAFSTTATTSGAVPGSNGVGNTYFLNAAGSWSIPAGGGGGISSVTGTTNQITATTSSGAVTLTLPVTVVAPGSLSYTTFLVNAGASYTAAGTTQATATPITTSIAYVTSAGVPSGVILPASAAAGTYVLIQNVSGTPFQIYPPVGGNLDGGVTNAGVQMPANGTIAYSLSGSSTWYSVIDAIGTGTGIAVTHGSGGVIAISLATVSNNTVLANISGGIAAPTALSLASLTSDLSAFSTTSTAQGVVPGSNSVGASYYLNGNGAWTVPVGTTYSNFSTSSTTAGLTPGSNSVGATYYLNGNGAWTVPVGTTYSNFSTSSTTAGLVPGSNSVGSTYYLNGSGAWTVPASAGVASLAIDATKTISFLTFSASTGAITLQAAGTKGDLHYCSATNIDSSLAIGTTGQALTVASGLPAWGAIGVPGGGTGLATLTQYGVLIGEGTGNVAVTAAGTVGYPLVANTSANPTFQQLSLTAGVTGTLPVANGGIGATTATANTIFSGPTSGSAAAPTFRAAVLADTASGTWKQEGLLYTTTGTPYADSSSTGSQTLYFGPTAAGNLITIYNGTSEVTQTFSEASLSVGALSAGVYDVYAVSASSTTVTLSTAAWSGNTPPSRSTQDGRLTKNGATTYLLVGVIGVTTGGYVIDWTGQRNISNTYNKRRRAVLCGDTTVSWVYASATIRAANGTTGQTPGTGRITFVLGDQQDNINVTSFGTMNNSSSTLDSVGTIGIGADTTTGWSSESQFQFVQAATINANASCSYTFAGSASTSNLGSHYLSRNESANSATSMTFYGNPTSAPIGAMYGTIYQ